MPIKDFICYSFLKLVLAVVSVQELQCQTLSSDFFFNFCMSCEI